MDYDVVRTSAAEGFRLVHLFGFGGYHRLGEGDAEMGRDRYFTFGGVPESFERRFRALGLCCRMFITTAAGRRKRRQELLAGSGRRWRLLAESEFLLFGLVGLGGRKPGEQL